MARKIVVFIPELDDAYVSRIADDALRLGFDFFSAKDRADALREASEAEVLFTADSGLCREARKLQWVCTPFAGVEPFLAPEIFANPEAVLTHSSGAYGVTIAEHVVMVVLEMMRRRAEYDEIIRRKGWRRDLRIDSIRGKRITLLGTGDIGRECAKRLRAFGPARLTGVNRRGENPEGLFDRILTADQLEEILPETDLLILSLPATAETRGILDAGRLALLPEGARLVNVGRGSAVDQKALERMLRTGKLAGCALDVFEEEPIPAEDTLWDCPGLLITPHTAGNMTLDYTVQKIVGQFLEDLENYAAGRPLRYAVDRKRAY
jgi:phosphoglycerate dehydrogenase-like enzyme